MNQRLFFLLSIFQLAMGQNLRMDTSRALLSMEGSEDSSSFPLQQDDFSSFGTSDDPFASADNEENASS